MTLLLITLFNAQADDTPTYAPVTIIDFEEIEATEVIDRPIVPRINVQKTPESEPGELIQKFIIEPSKQQKNPISLEETPIIGKEK